MADMTICHNTITTPSPDMTPVWICHNMITTPCPDDSVTRWKTWLCHNIITTPGPDLNLSQHNHNSRSRHDKYDCVPVSSDTDTDRRLLTFFLGSDQSSSTPISCLSRLCGTLGQAVVTIISSNIKIVQHYPSGCDVSWSFSRPKYKYISIQTCTV